MIRVCGEDIHPAIKRWYFVPETRWRPAQVVVLNNYQTPDRYVFDMPSDDDAKAEIRSIDRQMSFKRFGKDRETYYGKTG